MVVAQGVKVELTPERKFEELADACSELITHMNSRAFSAASKLCVKYLGHDRLAEQKGAEFEALPQTEKDDMKRLGNYGEYGVFHLMDQDEVLMALALVAHEILPTKKYLDSYREALTKQEMIGAIYTRFPDMTPRRIERILAL